MKRKDDSFTRVLRTFKDLQETTHILPTLMSHPSHLPISLSHMAMLPLLVSMVISSSFLSFAWEVVPSLPKCGEMIRHVQSNTANTDLFFTKRHMATRQAYVFPACHLSLATIWLGETDIWKTGKIAKKYM